MHTIRRHGGAVLAVLLGMLTFGGCSAAVFGVTYLARAAIQLETELGAARSLDAGSLVLATEVFDRHGAKIGEVGGERRYYVALSELPQHVVQAFLSAEDKDFHEHLGLDLAAIVRSALANLRGGGIRQGASTITQQLARISFLDSRRTFDRKIKEAMLALAIERRLTKSEILELYLNKIYLGNRSYGIEAAARNYFRKHAKDLDVGEAAILAGLPKAPSRYAPNRNAKLASRRQAFVLRRMMEDGHITPEARATWQKKVVRVMKEPERHSDAPYFLQAAVNEVERKLGLDGLPRTGLKVHTTLDLGLQQAARKALAARIGALRRQKREGPKGRIEGAIVSLDPSSGAVLAMQGGVSFEVSQFNRSLHARRRLGNLFTPVILGVAFDKGYALTSPVGRDPMAGGRPRGALEQDTIYRAFAEGRMIDLIPVFTGVGAGTVAAQAKRLGFDFERDDVTLALGYGEASASQVARAFAPLQNGGYVVEPYLVRRVETRDGRELYRVRLSRAERERALTASSAYVLRHLLRDKLRADTAGTATPIPERAFGLASANDDLQDAWFAGGTSRVVSAVWVGAETGRARLADTKANAARAALDAWTAFMRAAPTRYNEPERGPELPPRDVSFVRIDAETTQKTLPFVAGTEPKSARVTRF